MPAYPVTVYPAYTIPTVASVAVTPASITVATGSTTNFSASVTGTGSPAQTVIWNVEGETSAYTIITTGGALTVGSDEAASTLTVRAASTVDTAKSGTATVTVNGLPPVVAPTVAPPSTAPDRTITVVIGSTATMSVTAAGGAPMVCQWYRSTDGGANFAPIGATGTSYTTAPVTMANSGYRYYCTVTNEAGRAQSAVFTLQVVERGVNIPKTGDDAMPMLLLSIMLMAGAGLAASVVLRRRKRRGS